MRPLTMPKPRRWDEVVRRMPLDTPLLGAEVGVWQGRMSEQLLRQLPRLRLYLIDRWCTPPAGDSYVGSGSKISGYPQEQYEAAYKGTLRLTAFASDRVKILRMTTVEAAEKLAGKLFDFVFIDGDHSYKGCLADIIAWRPLVKPGGWLCGHDYHDDPTKQGEVKRAVLEQFPQGITKGNNSTWFIRL